MYYIICFPALVNPVYWRVFNFFLVSHGHNHHPFCTLVWCCDGVTRSYQNAQDLAWPFVGYYALLIAGFLLLCALSVELSKAIVTLGDFYPGDPPAVLLKWL